MRKNESLSMKRFVSPKSGVLLRQPLPNGLAWQISYSPQRNDIRLRRLPTLSSNGHCSKCVRVGNAYKRGLGPLASVLSLRLDWREGRDEHMA